MLTLKYADLTTDGLRKIAKEISVEFDQSTSRANLEEALTAARSGRPLTVYGQLTLAPGLNWAIISGITLLALTAVIAYSNQRAAQANEKAAEVAKQQFEVDTKKWGEAAEASAKYQKEAHLLEWQCVTVRTILDNATRNNNPAGLSLDEISQKYVAEVAFRPDIDTKKLSKDELLRVLYMLIRTGMAIETVEDRYVTNRQVYDSRFERGPTERRANYAICDILATEQGALTLQQLYGHLTKRLPITTEEYNFIINQLMAQNMIGLDEKGKVWPAASAPPLKGDQKASLLAEPPKK
jgi:hypothetical protein